MKPQFTFWPLGDVLPVNSPKHEVRESTSDLIARIVDVDILVNPYTSADVCDAPKPASRRVQYEGPFPRKRHSHKCLNCGGNSVACYKTRCTRSQRVDSCQWCR
jgi:hypothetical protein